MHLMEGITEYIAEIYKDLVSIIFKRILTSCKLKNVEMNTNFQ